MTLTISSQHCERLLEIAAITPDWEVCGLLLGTAREVREVRQTRNVADAPDRTFEIDPAALFTALREERAGGTKLIGYFHSHPTGTVAPSRTDFDRAAVDGRVWIIIAGDSLGAWQRTGGAFEPIKLVTD